MKDENFYTPEGWMVNDLHLTGDELTAFAIIYGVCQDGSSIYYGGAKYIAEWIGKQERVVYSVLRRLTEKGLIIENSSKGKQTTYTTAKNALLRKTHYCEKRKEPVLKIKESSAKNAQHNIKDNINININNSSSSSYSACAQDKNNNYYISLLTQWARAAALPEQFEREFYRREKTMPDFDEMVKEFYEGDFAAREETQRNERTEVLRHLTNWIRNQKIKDNGNNNTTRNQGTADKPKAVVQDDRDMPYDWFCNKERVETE